VVRRSIQEESLRTFLFAAALATRPSAWISLWRYWGWAPQAGCCQEHVTK